MADSSGNIDVDKLISFSDDLASVLKEERDMNFLIQTRDHFKALRLHCDAGYTDTQTLLQDYQKKIDECKKKTEKARLEVSADDELDLLQKELEQERKKECLLMEELR
ncbi:hypothetical protein M5689_009709 [Euphorbia peplus]|nr:hypothetical protein M5689_009709 [Euphorbia peplus]